MLCHESDLQYHSGFHLISFVSSITTEKNKISIHTTPQRTIISMGECYTHPTNFDDLVQLIDPS